MSKAVNSPHDRPRTINTAMLQHSSRHEKMHLLRWANRRYRFSAFVLRFFMLQEEFIPMEIAAKPNSPEKEICAEVLKTQERRKSCTQENSRRGVTHRNTAPSKLVVAKRAWTDPLGGDTAKTVRWSNPSSRAPRWREAGGSRLGKRRPEIAVARSGAAPADRKSVV